MEEDDYLLLLLSYKKGSRKMSKYYMFKDFEMWDGWMVVVGVEDSLFIFIAK